MEHITGKKPPGSFDFNFRMRYQLGLQIPITKKEIKKGVLFAYLSDELFVNFGKEIVYNYFDQNRVGVGLGYQITKSLSTNVGYQFTWQQKSKGNEFTNSNALRVILVQNFDLRKKND